MRVSPAGGGNFPPRGGRDEAAENRMGIRPERGPPAGLWGRRYKALNGVEMEGPRRRSADNLLSSAGWREAAGGGGGETEFAASGVIDLPFPS